MANKVAITTSTFGEYDSTPIELLKNMGYAVVLNPYGRQVTEDELVELAEGSVGLVAGTEKINEQAIGRLKSLKVISRCGAGIDNVDINAAERKGIKVFYTPDAPTLAVAELTIGLIFDLLRGITAMDKGVKTGNWKKHMGNLLSGKKAGIIGFGRIGKMVGQLLAGLGCEVAFFDPYVKQNKFKKMEMAELLGWADIVSIHVSGSEKLIGEKELVGIKDGAWLVNVSRGGVVDEDALVKSLKNGKLSGAALDVFEQEPYKGELRKSDRVVLTPHIGSYAKEARINMELQAVKNLIKGMGVES